MTVPIPSHPPSRLRHDGHLQAPWRPRIRPDLRGAHLDLHGANPDLQCARRALRHRRRGRPFRAPRGLIRVTNLSLPPRKRFNFSPGPAPESDGICSRALVSGNTDTVLLFTTK
jgi:hypothetical protein